MVNRQLVRWAVALCLALTVLAVPGSTSPVQAAQTMAAQKIQNRAGGCIAATSITLGANVELRDCASAPAWVVQQHPTNPNFYLIKAASNTSLCLGAVPQRNQQLRLASCSPTNTAWYIVLIGGYFFACHTHDTGLCASARIRPPLTLDLRNNGDTGQQFRLI